MAGGIGTRFWPMSTTNKPKQYLDVLNTGKTLIQETFARLTNVAPVENIFVVTNCEYKVITQNNLPQIKESQIITEPCAMNTAPCILYSILKINQLNPDANILISPSDHIILNEDEFVRIATQALDYTQTKDVLVTLGIQPTRPDIGYGYIAYEKDSTSSLKKVSSFKEKPKLEKAIEFLAAKNYLWNAGIFVSHSKTLLSLYQKHMKELYSLFTQDISVYNVSGKEEDYINTIYPKSECQSIDFGIIEKAENVYVIPSSFGWSDLGTWESVYETKNKDENQNVVDGNAIYLQEASKNYIKSENTKKLIVVKGLDNFIIIDTEDALLVCPMEDNQNIKQIVKKLEEKGFTEYI